MPMTTYTGETEIITKLGTTPAERGLETDQFKAKFDEGLKAFVTWFNDTHKTEFDAHLAEKATQAELGHIKKGSRLDIDENGVASVDIADIPLATTANVTYYVATTGNDENDGLSAETPFKTINKALSLIPQIVNHIITINIADGTYAEAVVLSGKIGKGGINLLPSAGVILTGITDSIAASATKVTLSVEHCYCGVGIINNPIIIKPAGDLGSSDYSALDIFSSVIPRRPGLRFNINGNDVTNTGIKKGITALGSIAYIGPSSISNCGVAIIAILQAKTNVYNVSGSGNSTVLYAAEGATISKAGTVPTGTTAETTVTGGVIR